MLWHSNGHLYTGTNGSALLTVTSAPQQLVEPQVNGSTLVFQLGDLAPAATAQLLYRVREGLLGAYAHQDMPFDRLVEALVPERDISRTPLFQVKVDLQNNSWPVPQLGDLKLTPLNLEHPASHFDLLLLLAESDQHLHVALHYKTDLFDEDTITRMLENFEQLLRHIVARPDLRLRELTELTIEADVQRRLSQQRERKELNIAELKNVKRHAVVT